MPSPPELIQVWRVVLLVDWSIKKENALMSSNANEGGNLKSGASKKSCYLASLLITLGLSGLLDLPGYNVCNIRFSASKLLIVVLSMLPIVTVATRRSSAASRVRLPSTRFSVPRYR